MNIKKIIWKIAVLFLYIYVFIYAIISCGYDAVSIGGFIASIIATLFEWKYLS